MSTKSVTIAALVLSLMACSPPDDASDSQATSNAIEAERSPSAPSASNGVADNVGPATTSPAAANGRSSRFTTGGLKSCRIVEQNEEEGQYFRHRCPGIGGYDYEVVESDLRQSLVIIAPGGKRSEVATSGVGGGGFNSFGPTFDWRGPEGQAPDVLTVRLIVARAEGKPDTPYLVVVRLAAPSCIVAVVEPGAGQSERARALADRDPLPACA